MDCYGPNKRIWRIQRPIHMIKIKAQLEANKQSQKPIVFLHEKAHFSTRSDHQLHSKTEGLLP